jgi:large subunit ribosomal protein L22
MEVTAKLSNLRIAPRKVRLVADVVRGKGVQRALDELSFVNNKSARPIAKLIKSAVANAKNNFQLNPDNLYISTIFVNEGSKLKRSRPRSRGQANEIIKRSSHVIVILNEKGKPRDKKIGKMDKKAKRLLSKKEERKPEIKEENKLEKKIKKADKKSTVKKTIKKTAKKK